MIHLARVVASVLFLVWVALVALTLVIGAFLKDWLPTFGTVTGVIGAITGTFECVISSKSYRRSQ
jgi:hypothetical protein